MITSAVILAGGMGTRLRSAVPDLPKPMAPIGGRPFLAHQMDYCVGQGIKRFILSVGYKRDIIINHFHHSYGGASIEYVEEDQPKGTGGGLLLAAYNEKQPIIVLNGDTFFRVNFSELATFHAQKSSDWTFALFKSTEADRYMGVELDASSKILSLKSGSKKIGCDANAGIYIINPNILMRSSFSLGQSFSLEDDLVPERLASGCRIYGLPLIGDFIDIGVPADYYRAADILI